MKVKTNILKYKDPSTNTYTSIPVVAAGTDISAKQDKNDNSLATASKTIVGAINELSQEIDNIAVPTKTSQLTNDSGYLTSVPSEYVTESELNNLPKGNVVYATCETAAATAAKVVTVSSSTNWSLSVGSVVMVYFTTSNSASNVTLNVNGSGAYPIWYNNAEYTSTGTQYTGYAKRVINYMFNGTHWVWIGSSYDSNTTYKNVSLGHGYATCDTAEATTAKVGTLASYSLTLGGIVAVKFTYAVPANATLNINSKGAKNIFYRGAKITAGIIKAGDIATFIYDGTQYQLLSIDRWQNDINAISEEIVDLKAQLGTQEIEIVSYTDGKYIASDGSVASSSSLCMVEAHGLIPNKKLHCTLWIDPNTYSNTAVGYDKNGTYVVGSDGFSWTSLGDNVYECTIPTNVEILKFNIYKTQKETMVCYMVGDEEYEYIPSYITHSVAKPLQFVSGKKLVAFGDSITFGIQSKIDSNGNTSQANDEVNQYIKLFCNKLGLTLTNKAISGTTLVNVAHPTETTLTADKSIYNQVITTNLSTYDYILIAGGCNDAVLQRTLGTIGSTDNKTVYGALELMCQYIQNNKKANAQVIFLTPIPLLRTLTIPLETYRNAVFEVAVKYGFNVVDGYKLGFPYEVSDYSKIVFPDGCHPSVAGHKMYANSLLGVLVGEMGMSTETWTFTLADGSTVTKEVYLK